VDLFDSMRIFAKVVEARSFTAAAAKLNISGSMASQHVKELEERLGARLLNRTTRRISLTDAGSAYYERCKRLLSDLEEAEMAVGEMQLAPRGELRINATPTFGTIQLAPAVADFVARYPLTSVELVLTDRMVDLIDEGFDVAVRDEPLPDSSLIARQLARCQVVICGAPAYFEKHGIPRMLDDLMDHNCLTMTAQSYLHDWRFTSPNGETRDIPPKGNFRSNTVAALLLAAFAGHGLVRMPTYLVADALRSGQLQSILDSYATPPLMLRALYPHSRHLSAKVRTFVDFLAERFGPQTSWTDDWQLCGMRGRSEKSDRSNAAVHAH
jgi:DNA-binding transcriptional LysR family regulator